MPTLLEIGNMNEEELIILSRSIFYGRAWNGKLGHYWLSQNRTLCDKDLVAHLTRYGRANADRPCKTCCERYKAVQDRRETLEQKT